MWSRQHTAVSVFLLLLAVTVLFGCRAFQPEVVIVNSPPETYIIGCPAETSGAYFHFHVYWYGTDRDGDVDRFVWALSDTSIQDLETDDDEEDLNFNPAVDISTLDNGFYTTRTDTIFDFQLNQGSSASHHMTLHMVAVDDRGDFDRTPARLHFYSNALGQPAIAFFEVDTNGTKTTFADEDTVPYGARLALTWEAETPNTRSFTPAMLETLERAQTVPVAPFDDGILGFKWQIAGDECGGGEDCWNPKQFDQAVGDSFSFFGPEYGITFLNDGSGPGFRGKVLPSGVVELLVNAIDVAGVEVDPRFRTLNVNVNLAPSTGLLIGESWNPVGVDPAHVDDQEYPYYVVWHGEFGPDINGDQPRFTFEPGDTVPNFATVYFKAIGRDNPLDLPTGLNGYGVQFQGLFEANGFWDGTIDYHFSSAASEAHLDSAWAATEWGELSGDTLSFMVGPVNYEFSMRAIDEHERRDGNPPSFWFTANYPPCVQCVEYLNESDDTVWDVDEPPCYDQDCLDSTSEMYAMWHGTRPPDPDRHYMSNESPTGLLWVNPNTLAITLETPTNTEGFRIIPCYVWTYRIALHGSDDPREDTGEDLERVMAWRYQVDYDRETDLDLDNVIDDGAGVDDITALTEERAYDNPALNDIFLDSDGIWYFRMRTWAPQVLVDSGPDDYWGLLLLLYPDQAEQLWELSTLQWGGGSIQVQATDAVSTQHYSARTTYYLYRNLRTPEDHGWASDPGQYDDVESGVDLVHFAKFSEIVTKRFQFVLETGDDGDLFVAGPHP